MDLLEQIDQHKYLWLAAIGEPKDNVLRLVIAEARASDTVEDLQIGEVTLPTLDALFLTSRALHEIVCENHIVDVVSTERPVVAVIRQAQQKR